MLSMSKRIKKKLERFFQMKSHSLPRQNGECWKIIELRWRLRIPSRLLFLIFLLIFANYLLFQKVLKVYRRMLLLFSQVLKMKAELLILPTSTNGTLKSTEGNMSLEVLVIFRDSLVIFLKSLKFWKAGKMKLGLIHLKLKDLNLEWEILRQTKQNNKRAGVNTLEKSATFWNRSSKKTVANHSVLTKLLAILQNDQQLPGCFLNFWF
mmetsp:Transcript_35235/g.48147  ORF Transcript_35235/g.48147 Transcript_35235/m.48147 type:complete len:208 (+) Transcript_35235:51-674(+)